MNVALPIHLKPSGGTGILAGVLEIPTASGNPFNGDIGPTSFWDHFGCHPMEETVGKNTLIRGGTLLKKHISQLCDGDHLFGVDLHSNGMFKVIGCAHQENTVRGKIRIRCKDWLLAGFIGSGYTSSTHVPNH